ncbi:MAG: hypothetical protein ACREJC_12140 [Tepidisphaeraceae bacterium]
MRRLTILTLALVAAGCAASGTSSTPNSADLLIHVKAVPKSGWQAGAGYGGGAAPPSGPFAQVNYESLDGIVVWIEPSEKPPVRALEPLVIDISRPRSGQLVCEAGRPCVLDSSEKVQSAFLRTETGEILGLGKVQSEEKLELPRNLSGQVEVMIASQDEPVARVYFAPSMFAKVASGGQVLRVPDLPPGRCTVTAWHERLPGSSTVVTLVPGKPAKAVVVVGVDQLSKQP